MNKVELIKELKTVRGILHEKKLTVSAGVVDKAIEEVDKPSITDLCREAHTNAVNKGWWDEPRSFAEVVALIHSEVSEALEDYRDGRGLQEIYYEGEKPCGIPIELADTIIRIFDTCGHHGIDLETAIQEKMKFNESRPVRHGGKKL